MSYECWVTEAERRKNFLEGFRGGAFVHGARYDLSSGGSLTETGADLVYKNCLNLVALFAVQGL
jgi:hypothetical protein